jgi:MFS family permease
MTQADAPAEQTLARRAAGAVLAVFALNGFTFAAWVSRLPAVRDQLDLNPSRIGVILLVGSAGSLVALPLTGALAERFGTERTTRYGALLTAIGFTAVAVAVGAGQPTAMAAALFVTAMGIGSWDVAMNIQGALVEQRLGRAIMPRFHAAFSLGAVAGAGTGALAAATGVSVSWHVTAVVVTAASLVWALAGRYLADALTPASPTEHSPSSAPAVPTAPARASAFTAWLEPRTVLVGFVVLAAALTEGSATDWLALAVVDGFSARNAVGALAFGTFVAAMSIMRLAGTALLDRYGRVPVLRACAGLALAGLLLFGLAPSLPLALVGVVAWGLGAALGFPVGISAASDDPARAAARVSVVSTIGYVAFLAGPPLIGLLAERVGYRNALLAIAAPLVLSLVLSPVVRPLPGAVEGPPSR